MTGAFTFPRGAFIGFENIFQDLERMTEHHKHDKYPPHNIVRVSDDEYLIELAVVSFKQKDISIKVQDGFLEIKGNRPQKREQDLYVHKGISGRSFDRTFRLSEHVEVKGADLNDGLLTIHLERVLPEDKRPRIININKSGSKDDKNKKEFLQEDK